MPPDSVAPVYGGVIPDGDVNAGDSGDGAVYAAGGRLAVVPSVEERVRAAVAAGAPSWAAVARGARCSRTWAAATGRRLGLQLPEAGAAREAVLSVRVQREAKVFIERQAAREGVTPSEVVRRLLREAVRAQMDRERGRSA